MLQALRRCRTHSFAAHSQYARHRSQSLNQPGRAYTIPPYLGGHSIDCDVHNTHLSFRVGSSFGHLAESSVLTSVGGTVVHATLCSTSEKGEENQAMGMLPLTVDYRSRDYAFGRIPVTSSRREKNNSDEDILIARIIDRSVRPLFPKGHYDNIQIGVTNHATDGINDPIVAAVNAASCAILHSQQPWNGPIGCVRVGLLDGKLIVNPNVKEMPNSKLDLLYSGTAHRPLMMEVMAHEVPEETMKEALSLAQAAIKSIIDSQLQLLNESKNGVYTIGTSDDQSGVTTLVKTNAKGSFSKSIVQLSEGMKQAAEVAGLEKASNIFHNVKETSRELRRQNENNVRNLVRNDLKIKYPNISETLLDAAGVHVISKAFRTSLLNGGCRADGRGYHDLRSLSTYIDTLPSVHGSAIFQRGDTHVLCTTTLGSVTDSKEVSPKDGRPKVKPNFVLHYDFPPYATGEVGSYSAINRRMVGHGNLAMRAVAPVIPSIFEYPFFIRVYSECTSSNGSSSMASAVGASLALIDAGVPIKSPVAGVSIGLVTSDDLTKVSEVEATSNGSIAVGSKYTLLTDILGMEDYYGDMDFKVAGSVNGITAIQMDVKLSNGIPLDIIKQALDHAKQGRNQILSKMQETVQKTQDPAMVAKRVYKANTPYAEILKFDADRKRTLVGPGGEMVKYIESKYKCEVNLLEEDVVYIYGENQKNVRDARMLIQDLVSVIKVGDTYLAEVSDIKDYGAMIKITRAQEALLHISEVTHDKDVLKKPLKDVLTVGQRIDVKVIHVDKQTGLIRASRKQLLDATKSVPDTLTTTTNAEPFHELPTFPVMATRKYNKDFFRENVVSDKEIQSKLNSPKPVPYDIESKGIAARKGNHRSALRSALRSHKNNMYKDTRASSNTISGDSGSNSRSSSPNSANTRPTQDNGGDGRSRQHRGHIQEVNPTNTSSSSSSSSSNSNSRPSSPNSITSRPAQVGSSSKSDSRKVNNNTNSRSSSPNIANNRPMQGGSSHPSGSSNNDSITNEKSRATSPNGVSTRPAQVGSGDSRPSKSSSSDNRKQEPGPTSANAKPKIQIKSTDKSSENASGTKNNDRSRSASPSNKADSVDKVRTKNTKKQDINNPSASSDKEPVVVEDNATKKQSQASKKIKDDVAPAVVDIASGLELPKHTKISTTILQSGNPALLYRRDVSGKTKRMVMAIPANTAVDQALIDKFVDRLKTKYPDITKFY